jgi:hypothetical protein
LRFTVDAHPGIADGSITVTYRNWRRPHVKVGGRYRVGSVDVVVDRISHVPLESLTDDDARAAGTADLVALRKFLHGSPETVWRIDFHAEPPMPLAREVAAATLSVEQVNEKLDRLDARAPNGPWTRRVLALIAERPGVVSTELAAVVGQERFAFKADVRKLKVLGLTESLEVGYRLTDLGRRVIAR